MICKIVSIIILVFSFPFLIVGQISIPDSKNKEDSYWSSDKTKMTAGWQSQYEPAVFKSNLLISLGYSISNFYNSPEIVANQIGLYNEFGLSNAEVYLQFGPELRLFKNLYVIPQGRVSFAWISGVESGGIGFLYSYGGSVGYIQPISDKANLSFEMGMQVFPIGENQNIFFVKVGLLFDFF